MNIKNNKGITLATLIITVVILIIIASVGVNYGINITKTANFENVETNLLLIQSKIKGIADKKAIGEITEDELYGTKQESGEYRDWYLLTQTDLNDMGLKDLDARDNYYVFYGAKDEETGEYTNVDVAYGNGIKYDECIYYKLSEILNNN